MLRRISQKKVREEVFEQLKELISKGQLRPGDRLPSERELAEIMCVSRSSVREAIMKLECMGVVEQRHGEGTYVKSVTSEPLLDVFEEFIKRENSLLELMEIRMVLETWAASKAAEEAGEKEILDLSDCLRKMEQSIKTGGKSEHSLNLKFHLLIAAASKNQILMHIMQTISDWIKQVTFELRYNIDYDSRVRHELLQQHAQILAAIRNRDGELAATKMKQHIEYTMQRIKKAAYHKVPKT